MKPAAIVIVGLVGVACAACGGSSSATRSPTLSGPVSLPPTTVNTTVTNTPTPTVTPSPTHTTTCLDTGIMVTAKSGGVGLGHGGVVLLFTDTGATPCTLHGYPGVAGLDAAGKQTVQAKRTLGGYLGGVRSGGEPTIVLQHDQMASALVEGFNDGGSSGCTEQHGLLVTPPGSTIATRLPESLRGYCDGVTVHPVVPGTSGDAPPPG